MKRSAKRTTNARVDICAWETMIGSNNYVFFFLHSDRNSVGHHFYG